MNCNPNDIGSYASFDSDISTVSAMQFCDVDQCEETMANLGVNQRVIQSSPGKFQGELAFSEILEGELFSDRFNTRLSVSLEPPAGTAVFLFPRSRSGKFSVEGRCVIDRGFVYLPSGKQVDMQVGEFSGSDSIIIANNVLSDLCLSVAQCSAPVDVAIHDVTNASVPGPGDLFANAICVDSRGYEEQLSQLVLELVSQVCPGQAETSPPLNYSRQALLAKDVRHYLHEHYRERIRLEQLSSETCVTLRTLQRAFRGHFGVTISAYLGILRLNAARVRLRSADQSQSSISKIALECGFTHLGRFSTDYRKYFGEPPSMTQARGGSLA